MSIRTYFKNIADAIKEKNPEVSTVTPAEMPQAILDIPSGGGSEYIAPLEFDMRRGYVSSTSFIYNPSESTLCDVYEITNGRTYILTLGATYDNRFRALATTENTTTITTDTTGRNIVNNDSPNSATVIKFVAPLTGYLTVLKTNRLTYGVKTILMDITEFV